MRQIVLRGIPLPILTLFLCEIALACIYLGNMWFGRPLGPLLTDQFDLDGERNIPTWYSSTKLFLVALLFLLLAVWSSERRRRSVFSVLFIMFLALSCDEFVGIHEKIGVMSDALLPGGDRRNTPFVRTGVWVFFLGIPLLIVVILVLHRLSRFVTDRTAIALYMVGFGIFIGSAVGLETLLNFIVAGPYRLRLLQVAAEELGEMAGVTFILWATWRLLEGQGVHLFPKKSPPLSKPLSKSL